jgi:hypothetical protein
MTLNSIYSTYLYLLLYYILIHFYFHHSMKNGSKKKGSTFLISMDTNDNKGTGYKIKSSSIDDYRRQDLSKIDLQNPTNTEYQSSYNINSNESKEKNNEHRLSPSRRSRIVKAIEINSNEGFNEFNQTKTDGLTADGLRGKNNDLSLDGLHSKTWNKTGEMSLSKKINIEKYKGKLQNENIGFRGLFGNLSNDGKVKDHDHEKTILSPQTIPVSPLRMSPIRFRDPLDSPGDNFDDDDGSQTTLHTKALPPLLKSKTTQSKPYLALTQVTESVPSTENPMYLN